MSHWIRDATAGQIIRFVTRNRFLQYPEERADFVCPSAYTRGVDTSSSIAPTPAEEKPEVQPSEPAEPTEPVEPVEPVESAEEKEDLEKIVTAEDGPHLEGIRTYATQRSQIERVGTRTALQRSLTQKDLENQF